MKELCSRSTGWVGLLLSNSPRSASITCSGGSSSVSAEFDAHLSTWHQVRSGVYSFWLGLLTFLKCLASSASPLAPWYTSSTRKQPFIHTPSAFVFTDRAATQSKRPNILIEAETARIAQIANRSQKAALSEDEKNATDANV